jgi:hypothetical protein
MSNSICRDALIRKSSLQKEENTAAEIHCEDQQWIVDDFVPGDLDRKIIDRHSNEIGNQQSEAQRNKNKEYAEYHLPSVWLQVVEKFSEWLVHQIVRGSLFVVRGSWFVVRVSL